MCFLQFFPHLDRALSEFHRALKPNGRVAVTTWAGDDSRWNWFEDLAERMDLSAARLVVSGLESILEKMDRNVNSRMLAEVLLLDLPKV